MDIVYDVEKFHDIYSEVLPLMRDCYYEIGGNLEALGMIVPPFNPRLDDYMRYSKMDVYHVVTARVGGVLAGFTTAFLSHNMHNSEAFASEDMFYIVPAFRKGLSTGLIKYGIKRLRARGVKQLKVTTMAYQASNRVCERIGFKLLSYGMTYQIRG